MMVEGFPPLAFSDRALVATIEGAPEADTLNIAADAAVRPLVAELETAFAESDGAALLVYRDGRLVLEHYGAGFDAETPINSFSMAKGLVGALVYKALDEGRIGSLDERLSAYLPADAGLADVTLRGLLTMRAGIHFDSNGGKYGSAKDSDTAANPFGPLARLHFMGLAAIEGGLEADPTARDFSYQNVNTALLGAVLERVYGRPLEALLAEKIWQPAQAGAARWRKPAADLPVSAYCCIYATARDWVRVGAYLNGNGTANAPFLSDRLWRDYMGLDVAAAERAVDHYGNHVLQNVLDRDGQALQGPFTYLMGQNGQILYLMPERDLVVYRAGGRVQLLHSTLYGAWNSVTAP